MQALVLGGTGGMGQAAARDLMKQEQVKKVILGDIITDPNRLYEKLRTSEKVSLIRLDVNDNEGLLRAMKDVDVVVNCAGPFHKTGVTVSRAAIEAKVNYIDISDEYKTFVNLFIPEIDRAAKEAGITILTGMGSDPGTNNLIAKHHADHLDRVDEIDLYWVVSIADLEEGATAGAAWDHSLHMNTGTVPQYPRTPWILSDPLCGTSSATHNAAVYRRRKKGRHQGCDAAAMGRPANQRAE
jgi:saccharopine dehydrogenase (NAD+, L-lysine-forming)